MAESWLTVDRGGERALAIFYKKTPHFTRHLHHSQFLVMVFGGETLQFWGLNMP